MDLKKKSTQTYKTISKSSEEWGKTERSREWVDRVSDARFSVNWMGTRWKI